MTIFGRRQTDLQIHPIGASNFSGASGSQALRHYRFNPVFNLKDGALLTHVFPTEACIWQGTVNISSIGSTNGAQVRLWFAMSIDTNARPFLFNTGLSNVPFEFWNRQDFVVDNPDYQLSMFNNGTLTTSNGNSGDINISVHQSPVSTQTLYINNRTGYDTVLSFNTMLGTFIQQ